MKEFLTFSYYLFSGIVFYTYLYMYIFNIGYFSFLNPLKQFKSANDFLEKKFFSRIKSSQVGDIFPFWNLFINMSAESFYDLVVEARTINGKIFKWTGTKDYHIGSLKTKNPFFISSIVSVYKQNRIMNKILINNVLNFFEKEKETPDTISINFMPFFIPENIQKEPTRKNLSARHYIWQNRKLEKYSRLTGNLYELL